MRRGASRRKDLGGHRVSLGIVASSAPSSALLAALRELRPQFSVHLQRISDPSGRETLYRVQIDIERSSDQAHNEADMWMAIKSALLSAFPFGKPGAVTAIDP
jgi:hypothetical protein